MNRSKKIKAMALCAVAIFLVILIIFIVNIFKNNIAYNKYINKHGNTIQERFKVPKGFIRVSTEDGSFEYYLQNYRLKKWHSHAKHYDGKINRNAPALGVFDQDITPRNLQQCADACMRLFAEYLYEKEQYDKISFNFVNGFQCDYRSFAEGKRVHVDNTSCYWYEGANKDYSYSTFRLYMDLVHNYANTESLQKQSEVVLPEEIRIGDIYVMTAKQMQRGLGHAVIVVDICVNIESGERLLLIAESTTPATETYVVCGDSLEYGPWISIDESGTLITSNWVCEGEYIRRMR